MFSTDGGSFEHYFTADGTKLAWARYSVGLQNDFTITNITVQEVDWNFGGGWSLGSNKALATAAVGGDTLSQTGVFTLDKSYKTTFLSTMEVGDNCFAEFGSDGFIGQLPTGTASNLFYYQTNEVGDSARIAFEVQSIMTGSISNVLTYQMDPNGYWNIPTANSTQLVLNPTFTNTGPEEVTNGDFSGTALGSELVTDGEFPSGTTAWATLGTSTINVGSATVEGLGTLSGASANRGVSQPVTILAGTSYKITFTAKQLTGSGVMYAGLGYTQPFSQVITNDYEVYTFDQVPANVSGSWPYICFGGAVGSTFEIKDVSVKEVLQLVSNGDFTDGVELLTQPIDLTADFIPNGSGVIDDSNSFTTTGGVFDGLRNNSSSFQLIDGKSYKLVIAGTTTSSGFTIGSVTASGNEYGTGFGTHYFVATTANPTTLWIRQQTAGTTDLTTFTIEELGADWTLGTGWSIGDAKAIRDGSGGANTFVGQTINVVTGRSYKVSYERTYISGGGNTNLYSAFITSGVNTTLGNLVSTVQETVTVTAIFTPTYTGSFVLRAYGIGTFTGSITNISVQELGEGWTVVDNAAGDTVTFGGSSATWTKTVPEAVYLQQDYPVTLGASHKLTYTVLSNTYTGGGTELGLSSASAYGQSPIPSSVGTHTVYLIVSDDTPTSALRFYSNDTGGSLEITNISVEELGLDWVSPDAGVVNTFSATGLTMTSVNGAGDNTIRQDNVTADDQAYKVDYNIVGSSLTSGSYLQFYNGATYVNMKTTVGSHILHFTRSGADDSVFLKLASNDGSTTDTVDIGSITIVEVQGWTLEDGKLVGDLPDLAKSATQDIGAIAGNSYKATMDVAIAEEELITNGSFREVGADLVLDGDFPLPNVNWLIAASTTINGGSATFGGLGTVADLLAAAFVVRVEADGGVAEAQSCLISDLTFLTEKP